MSLVCISVECKPIREQKWKPAILLDGVFLTLSTWYCKILVATNCRKLENIYVANVHVINFLTDHVSCQGLCSWQPSSLARWTLVSSPDLIWRVYRFQYNARYWKRSTLGLVWGLGLRLGDHLRWKTCWQQFFMIQKPTLLRLEIASHEWGL